MFYTEMPTGLRTKLERELECLCCLERLKDPRVFPHCQHTFCYQCIRKLFHGKSKVLCPSCRAEVEVGNPPDISKFKRAFIVSNIVEHMERAHVNGCRTHDGEQFQYFCKTCETPTCKDCTLQDHREHDYCPIHNIAEEYRKSLAKKLGIFREKKAILSDSISDFEALEEKFKIRNEKVKDEINQHFDALVKKVESQRLKLLGRANELTEFKSNEITKNIGELQLIEGCLASNIDFVETRFYDFKDEEVINVEKRFSQDVENCHFGNEYERCSMKDDMKFLVLKGEKDFEKDLVESNLVANCNICVEKCISFLEPNCLKQGEQAAIAVICKDSSNCDIEYGGQVIRADFTGSATVREFGNDDSKDGKHYINFLPTSCGELIIKVYINGQEAPNCIMRKTVRRSSKMFHYKSAKSSNTI